MDTLGLLHQLGALPPAPLTATQLVAGTWLTGAAAWSHYRMHFITLNSRSG